MSTQETYSISSTAWCRRYASAALLLVVGVAISVAIFFVAYHWERNSILHEFDSLAADRFHAIDNKVDDSASLLHFADNALLVGPRGDSPDFPRYLDSLAGVLKADLARYPAVQSMTWMPRVPRNERDVYEQAARKTFDPTFRFSESGVSIKSKSGKGPETDFLAYLCITAAPNDGQPCKASVPDPTEQQVMYRALDSGTDHRGPADKHVNRP